MLTLVALSLPLVSVLPDTLPAAAVQSSELRAVADSAVAGGRLIDVPIRTIDGGEHHFGVGLVHRPAGVGGGPASHDLVSEVYHILEGSGTLVTGGTMTEPRRRDASGTLVVQVNGPGYSGTAIEGGVSRRVQQGDIVLIPAGTPHGWSEVTEALLYTVVRVDPQGVVTLR